MFLALIAETIWYSYYIIMIIIADLPIKSSFKYLLVIYYLTVNVFM